MIVTFTGHAGISVTDKETTVVVDPWFHDSNVDDPVMHGFLGYKTIDFQVPRVKQDIEAYRPQGIFISHFHPHHAYPKDIHRLIEQSSTDTVVFGHPDVGAQKAEEVQKTLHDLNNKAISFFSARDTDSIEVGSLKVTAMEHTVPQHIAWYISNAKNSVLHIADPQAQRGGYKKGLGHEWERFADLRPDILFINASGNSLRKKQGGVRTILENACISVGEAVEVVRLIKPKAVSLIGCYNRSVWNGALEYVRPASVVEEEFYWGMSWVNPDVRCIFVKPGHRYVLGESGVTGADSFIS